MQVLIYAILGGALAGGAAVMRHALSYQSRVLYLSIGVVCGLIVALLTHMRAPIDHIRAAFENTGLISLAFFAALLCAFGYQGLAILAPEAPDRLRVRILRWADAAFALAIGLMIAGLLLWNLALTA